MSRIAQVFAQAKAAHSPVLIPYFTVGDPSLEASLDVALALAEAGAGILELGVPFSDPVADGPVIQAASQRALARGTRLADVLELTAKIRARSQVGLLLFSYFNPILRYGLQAFARDAAAVGADGVLVTDLIADESADYRATVRAAGLDTVFLAAPTSPDARLASIGEASSGFIYAVSRLGVTGARAALADGAEALVARIRRQTKLPIALGFGLSRADQVAQVAAFADGAVVGTALVQAIADAPGHEAQAAAALLRSLRG